MPLKKFVTNVPDFPKKGIVFRDMSALLRHRFHDVLEHLENLFTPEEWEKTDAIAGIESRGFTLAAGLAGRLNKNILHIRKAGKLPGRTLRKEYGLEYGTDALEMHYGDGNIIILDDVLATGGTLKAACECAQETGHNIIGIGVLMNLTNLNNFSFDGQNAKSVMQYD